MKHILIKFALLFGLAISITACKTMPVYNVDNAALPISSGHSLEEVSAAIKRAGAGLGWQVKETTSGHNVGTLILRTHTAIVDINYTTTSFSITYKDSTNLKYDGFEIHKNYNGWIQNLENAILSQTASR